VTIDSSRQRVRGLAAFLLLAALFPLAPAPAAAQDADSIRFKTRALEVTLGGRVQVQFSTTDSPGGIPYQWELRRARLEFQVRANELLSARIQPEFVGATVGLRDAFVQVDLGPAAQLIAGQAFRPFSLLSQTSSTRILPIERGARIRGLGVPALEHYNLLTGVGYADRDVGLQLRGEPVGAPLGLAYAVGIFNGPLFGLVGSEPTYQAVGRVTVEPLRGVRVGVAGNRRDYGQALPAQGEFQLRTGTAWQADIQVGTFAAGPHLLAEYAEGDLDPFVTGGRRFRAAQLWAAYRTRAEGPHRIQLEPIFRVSYGNTRAPAGERSAGAGGGVLATPGLNLYLGPLNRLMINYDLWAPLGGARRVGSFKTMMQMAF
jgi:hypothetical protein